MDPEWLADQIDALHKRIDAQNADFAAKRGNDNYFYQSRIEDMARDITRLTTDIYLLKRALEETKTRPTTEFPFSTN